MFVGEHRGAARVGAGGVRPETERAHVEKVAGVGWGPGWSPGPGLECSRRAFLRQEPGEGASGDLADGLGHRGTEPAGSPGCVLSACVLGG